MILDFGKGVYRCEHCGREFPTYYYNGKYCKTTLRKYCYEIS